MESPAGWTVHLWILGALAAVGVVLTVLDYAGPSSGGWISLRGVISSLYWVVFGVFAAASSIIFAVVRTRVGVPLSYALAFAGPVVLAAVIWAGWRALEAPVLRQANERHARDVGARLTLESWSMAEEPDGLLRFRVAVRADIDGSVEFEPLAAIKNQVAVDNAIRSDERQLKAGERAVLEATAKRTAPGTFDSFDLYLISRPPNRQTGHITYSSDTQEDTVVYGMLKRPLPARSATIQ